jgi:hypothetical protein
MVIMIIVIIIEIIVVVAVQFYVSYIPSQQLQGQLQKQCSIHRY